MTTDLEMKSHVYAAMGMLAVKCGDTETAKTAFFQWYVAIILFKIHFLIQIKYERSNARIQESELQLQMIIISSVLHVSYKYLLCTFSLVQRASLPLSMAWLACALWRSYLEMVSWLLLHSMSSSSVEKAKRPSN